MIRLKQFASNMAVLYKNGDEILFSYQTPVAVYDRKKGMFLKTSQKWSSTTSRHITKWLNGVMAEPVAQDIIESYCQ